MPNWCQNSMLITGSKVDIETLVSKVKTTENNFDFNGIIPMPQNLSVESSSTAKTAYAVFYGTNEDQRKVIYEVDELSYRMKLNQIRKDPEAKALADHYHNNQKQYGHTNWYDWCNAVWGTKWNASDVNMGKMIKVAGQELYQIDVYFQTAWSFPQGIFEELAKQYPQLTFSVDVDEEGGYFWGNILIQNGKVIENLQEGTRPGGPYDYGDEDDDCEDED